MERLPIAQGPSWVFLGAALIGLGMVRNAAAQKVPRQEPFGGTPPALSAP
jgi:hypothetical protein